MELPTKTALLSAWVSFLLAEIWSLVWETEFFLALEKAFWFSFMMGFLGWLSGVIWQYVLIDINYFGENEEEEESSISKVDYTLPEDMPLSDFEGMDATVADDGIGMITADKFEQEIMKMADENPEQLANTVKTELIK